MVKNSGSTELYNDLTAGILLRTASATCLVSVGVLRVQMAICPVAIDATSMIYNVLSLLDFQTVLLEFLCYF